ncbi:MAG: glutamate synthase large subunit [Sporomusaceae bacterium]|nr:glutamate synthase large subunit [Sporomusaceae bacterium]
MGNTGLPPKQGLYNPEYEHDACGIGVVANIKGKKSNEILHQALTVLLNMEHRGGAGADTNSGDGAGVLLQIPHKLFKHECTFLNIDLPPAGKYGVGMVFLPQEKELQKQCEEKLGKIIAEQGQKLLGWRTVPCDTSMIGETAKAAQPTIRQVFIAPDDLTLRRLAQDEKAFERKLYVIRKRAENEIRYGLAGCELFYFSSLSAATIVYKGMLTPKQLDEFFIDLQHPMVETAVAMVHSRFSTNTFPSWERAHPYRYIMHNGEINTRRGNLNWMHARQALCESPLFGSDMKKLLPVIDASGSDSGMFDNCLEFLTMAGRSLPHAAMMMVPEPWSNHESMSDEKKAFFEYHSCMMEPWDGPAAVAFTDGKIIGAILDRNGLRPARYYVTKDDTIVLASEVGVVNIAPENIAVKERLRPGKMLLVDMEAGRIVSDEEIKNRVVNAFPYQQWLDENILSLSELPAAPTPPTLELPLTKAQQAFGYTFEELTKLFRPMAKDGADPIGAMGMDSPLAVLSDKPQLFYNYFKQLFAQVTNPPIDGLREAIVTSTGTAIGPERNLIDPQPESCRQIRVDTPILTNDELAKLRHIKEKGFEAVTLPMVYPLAEGGEGLAKALENLCALSDKYIAQGKNLLILSDRSVDEKLAPIPALLATACLQRHMVLQETRLKASLLVETGEPREVHHFALLLGYGAAGINPYLAFDTIKNLVENHFITDITVEKAIYNYTKGITKGIVKVLSKMGISTIASYQGAQIFEAIGVSQEIIDKYFTDTPACMEGIGLAEIATETKLRHSRAFTTQAGRDETLDSGSTYQWRSGGEEHLYNPETITTLQQACQKGDYELFKQYTSLIDQHHSSLTLRGLLQFKKAKKGLSLDEVESVESICHRFKTGAMSYGSLSQEAHECLAIAMNRIGGKSNTGEGGENPERFIPLANGDSRSSAIKQIASGRFGVTSHYLAHADEIQIKMAQGAKPGEGGQLPGKKVYPWVAEVRGTTAGVGLISPPPHHDIYSIEDLAELIHDLKNANPKARINVKLVAEAGVGTIAAGVAKARADVILISGYDGGTGASPRTSIRHTGLPWEVGLAETHQTLLLNNLRDRVTVETDGKLMTGRDVAIAALLGAEEFGFATAPLVVMGCVMMRVCNLDTCPVGVATQNPKLRQNFAGKPEHVVNFMHFIASQLREIMAELGIKTVNELIGRTDLLEQKSDITHWKAKSVDISALLYQPQTAATMTAYCSKKQDHNLEKAMDNRLLRSLCAPAIDHKEKVSVSLPIKNTDRVVGTILGHEITSRYGAEGLPEDTLYLKFTGSAGQSFGAFIPRGMTLALEGDSNDHVGKGLSGGKIIVYPPKETSYAAEHNIIIGNVAFYGATSGEAYVRGVAGERFCVRNSGANVVVEGVGEHGCEYMTGGRVIILGKTGRNFAAGMSGGIAYVYDPENQFAISANLEMVTLEKLEHNDEVTFVKTMLENHYAYTKSEVAQRLLTNWYQSQRYFIRVIPKDYKRALAGVQQHLAKGLSKEAAIMRAFEENSREASRVGGN